MAKYRIVVLDNISSQGLDLLEHAEDIEHEVHTGLADRDLADVLRQFDGAICRSGVKITADVLTNQRKLKAIVRAGVGTDNIDRAAATRQGVVVMNTPTGNTLSTAEHAFALLLALSRNVAPAYQSLCEGKWNRSSYMGVQLADKTLGIVGLGRIGREVAKRALAFEMRVIGQDPYFANDQMTRLGIEPADTVAEMIPRVDYLTVHTPLTPETEGLFGFDEIETCKPGLRLINCARGGIYDEQALAEGLKRGKLGGVALDVFESEPCTDSPLFGLPGVVCTPHLGASTEEAQTKVALEAVQLLTNFLTTGEIRHAVNMATIDPQALAAISGYMDVAYRLGLLLSQFQTGIDGCELTYRGEVSEKDTRLLTASFCAGLLERALDEEINIVNSEVLVKDRGIQLAEKSVREMGAFSSSITASVTSGDQVTTVAGTLFGNNMPRLVRFGGYRLEAYLDGNMLIFSHEDVPGIIGSVGTIFGNHNINIAQMAVGREGEQRGGSAVGVLNLDEPAPTAAIDDVMKLAGIQTAKSIQLPPAGDLPPWM